MGQHTGVRGMGQHTGVNTLESKVWVNTLESEGWVKHCRHTVSGETPAVTLDKRSSTGEQAAVTLDKRGILLVRRLQKEYCWSLGGFNYHCR